MGEKYSREKHTTGDDVLEGISVQAEPNVSERGRKINGLSTRTMLTSDKHRTSSGNEMKWTVELGAVWLTCFFYGTP